MIRRLAVALALTFSAVAAFAADPLAVRVAVYQRMPQLQEGYAPEIENLDTVLAAPAAGWPDNFDAMRVLLTARQKGRQGVMLANLLDPKPLQAEPSAAFFIQEVAHALEVRANGAGTADLLLPSGKHLTVPAVPNSTILLGGKDEQLYVAVMFKPWSQLSDDTAVLLNGAKPLRVVSRVEPKIPAVDGWRNRSSFVVAQLRVEPDGSVSSVEVLQKVQPQIDAAATDALKQWKFEPPTKNGHPVAAYMIFSVPFHID